MSQTDDLKLQFTYDTWANRQMLDSLRQVPNRPPRAVAILSHVFAAQHLWLDRLLGLPQSMAVWPELSFDEMTTLNSRMEKQWQDFLGNDAVLAANDEVQYTNSKGESFRNRPSEIITQVLMHGAYHRGQIALLLRQAGVTPPYTDFIHAIRTGAITA